MRKTPKRYKTGKVKLSLNQMLDAIEREVCIRGVWRCRAGWGLQFILLEDYGTDKTTVYSYRPSLLMAVRDAYRYWVLKENVKLYPKTERTEN